MQFPCLELESKETLLIYISILFPSTIIIPIIGRMGDRIDNKKMYQISAIGIILTSIPFYFSILFSYHLFSIIFLIILVLFFTIQFALIPSLIADLYPTSVRFTCIGFSFNITDSVIGGIVPILGVFLVHLTGNAAAFVTIFPISAIIFLISLRYVKLKK